MKKTNLTLAETNGIMEMLMARKFVEQKGELSENDIRSLTHVAGMCKYLIDISEKLDKGKALKNLEIFQEAAYGKIE